MLGGDGDGKCKDGERAAKVGNGLERVLMPCLLVAIVVVVSDAHMVESLPARRRPWRRDIDLIGWPRKRSGEELLQ